MIRTILRPAAALAVPAMLLFGAATADAASLSPAAPLERAIAASEAGNIIKVGEGNQLRRERMLRRRDLQQGYIQSPSRKHRRHRRHRRHHRYNNGIHFGFIAPYRSYQSRGYSNACSYWSRRCTANWGYGNSNYYGCLRYHGC